MSYRLIDANALAISRKEVNDMPCIYADLPNGLDGGYYDLARAERTCKLDYERHCSNCGVYVHASAVLVRKNLDGGTWTVVSKPVSYCPNCGCKVVGE